MFEGVFRVRRAAASENQLGAHESRQCVGAELLSANWLPSADQLMRELPAKRRSDLRHLTNRRQTIKPGQERGVQGRRDG
jgi:hypothetical protein